MSKHSSACARIRELSALGLRGGLFVSAVFQELRHVLSCGSLAHFWLDERGSVINYYRDEPLAGTEAHMLSVDVLGKAGAVIGRIVAYRDAGHPPFDAADRSTLAAVARYVAQGLAAPLGDEPSIPGPASFFERELVVCDESGEVLQATQHCRHLLLLATGLPLQPNCNDAAHYRAGNILRALCRMGSRPGDAAAGSAVMHETTWGRFVFRVFPLTSMRGGGCVYGVQLEREKPAVLRIMEAIAQLGLSPQQGRIALMVAMGKTNRLIAEELSLSINTVGFHVKSLFARLRVHDRTGLLVALQGHAPYQPLACPAQSPRGGNDGDQASVLEESAVAG